MSNTTSVVTPAAGSPVASYFNWSAIFAGAAVALATSMVFVGFGSALGLGLVSPWDNDGAGVTTIGIIAAIWFLASTAFAYYVGGYVAGRMRPPVGDATGGEVEMRDALHGAVIWALGVFVFAWIGISTATSVATGAAQVGSAAVDAAGSVVQSDGAEAVAGYTVDKLTRATPPISASRASEVREQGAQILARAVADGELDADDKTYLAELVASRTALTQEEAEARVDEVYAEAQSAAEAAADAAEEATDAAQNATLVMGFLTATGFLIALVAAWFGATMGGSHRDGNTVSRVFVARRV